MGESYDEQKVLAVVMLKNSSMMKFSKPFIIIKNSLIEKKTGL